MNQYPVRYAFRLDPATEAALEQISRHTFQSKASIMRRYIQDGVKNEAEVHTDEPTNNVKTYRGVLGMTLSSSGGT
jgi:hypothetical protein